MKTQRNMLIVMLVLLALCFASFWFASSSRAADVVYEVRPQGAIPYGYGPEPSRLIDLIEHVLIENQQVAQRQLTRINTNLKVATKKLDKIEKNLVNLTRRIARIETALGIKPPPKPKHVPTVCYLRV